jgi:hypothetical protein
MGRDPELRLFDGGRSEAVLAALVTLVGIALTSFGVFTHTAPAVAPGATLALLGGAWLGNSLARRVPPETA